MELKDNPKGRQPEIWTQAGVRARVPKLEARFEHIITFELLGTDSEGGGGPLITRSNLESLNQSNQPLLLRLQHFARYPAKLNNVNKMIKNLVEPNKFSRIIVLSISTRNHDDKL